jgi:heme/copper-type cytochrome/quinol oxidase subunit 4
MGSSDILFLAVGLAISVIVTAVSFCVLKLMNAQSRHLKVGSALAFPSLLIMLIVYIENWKHDPHGIAMIALGFLAIISLPVTIFTAKILARRFC